MQFPGAGLSKDLRMFFSQALHTKTRDIRVPSSLALADRLPARSRPAMGAESTRWVVGTPVRLKRCYAARALVKQSALPWSISVVAALTVCGAALAGSASALPVKFRKAPYSMMSLSVGYPNDGWQLRAKRLRSSRYIRIKPGSPDRSYGHPALILMLERSAKELQRVAPGSVLMVGDISDANGGPLAGHHSHQSGRDADVAFYVLDENGKRIVPDHYVKFGVDGKALDGSGYAFDDWRNWLLVQSWVRDQRAGLSHIFISRLLRQRLIAYASKQSAFMKYVAEVSALLKQPEDAEPHDDHFHVRVSCPKDQNEICHEQSR
jgi:murein endopeptidase